MAINAATVWEIRAAGNAANGGGFYDRDPGTSVDYSQQDAAQLTVTDLATDGAGTGLSSVTGGFTAAMAGNIIQISGGDLTAGWYEITAYADTNNVTIDRTAGASKAGGTGNVGGAFAFGGANEDAFIESFVNGNTAWIKAGTHTLGASISVGNAATTATKDLIGYSSSRGDNPTGANRPTIACGAYTFLVGLYWNIKNLIFTGTATYVLAVGTSNAVNCKATNSSETANRSAFSSSSQPNFTLCEGVSTNGRAFSLTGNNARFAYCFAHDSVYGIYDDASADIFGCVIDTCSNTGILVNNKANVIHANNTIYGCGVGLSLGGSFGAQIINNIISGCTTGATALAAYPSNFFGGNCWNNTTDTSNITKGDTDITADPLMVNPAADDFTLNTSSPCFDAGLQPGASIGLP